jgi:hypothetical protein
MEIARQRIRVGVEEWKNGRVDDWYFHPSTLPFALLDFPEMPNSFPDLVKTPAFLNRKP